MDEKYISELHFHFIISAVTAPTELIAPLGQCCFAAVRATAGLIAPSGQCIYFLVYLYSLRSRFLCGVVQSFAAASQQIQPLRGCYIAMFDLKCPSISKKTFDDTIMVRSCYSPCGDDCSFLAMESFIYLFIYLCTAASLMPLRALLLLQSRYSPFGVVILLIRIWNAVVF